MLLDLLGNCMSEKINAFIRGESEIRGVEVNVEGFPV